MIHDRCPCSAIDIRSSYAYRVPAAKEAARTERQSPQAPTADTRQAIADAAAELPGNPSKNNKIPSIFNDLAMVDDTVP